MFRESTTKSRTALANVAGYPCQNYRTRASACEGVIFLPDKWWCTEQLLCTVLENDAMVKTTTPFPNDQLLFYRSGCEENSLQS